MYYLLIRRIANGYTIHAHALAYETRAQLDHAYDRLRQCYAAPVIFTKLQEIQEVSHD